MTVYLTAMACEGDAVRGVLAGDDALVVSGIGKVNAAAAAQAAIDRYGAEKIEIVNAGVCGGFGSGVRVFGVYEVRAAVEYDFDLAQLNGTRVGQLDERDSPFLPLAVTGRLPAKILATGDRFSDDLSDRDLIVRELGAELRDMEGAAVAHVCLRNGVRCRAVKCVTDTDGGGSMTEQYRGNRARALAALAEALRAMKG